MKKLVFAILMCLASLSLQAQVITFATVARSYGQLTLLSESDFAYSADFSGYTLTTMYVYTRHQDRRGVTTLEPYRMHRYVYDADGMLLSRTTHAWQHKAWQPVGQLSYSRHACSYQVAYSRWNARAARFDAPVDMMTYTLLSDAVVNDICCYHRERPADAFTLAFRVFVDELPFYPDSLAIATRY